MCVRLYYGINLFQKVSLSRTKEGIEKLKVRAMFCVMNETFSSYSTHLVSQVALSNHFLTLSTYVTLTSHKVKN